MIERRTNPARKRSNRVATATNSTDVQMVSTCIVPTDDADDDLCAGRSSSPRSSLLAEPSTRLRRQSIPSIPIYESGGTRHQRSLHGNARASRQRHGTPDTMTFQVHNPMCCDQMELVVDLGISQPNGSLQLEIVQIQCEKCGRKFVFKESTKPHYPGALCPVVDTTSDRRRILLCIAKADSWTP